jgi:hypothetical protein
MLKTLLAILIITISTFSLCAQEHPRGDSSSAATEKESESNVAPRNLKKSGNPIITHMYTADPSAHLFNGRIYIYPSHDQDKSKWYHMVDYHVFSSADMVHWKDHGAILDIKNVPWAKKWMWAPDCAYKDGTYYFYFPARDHSNTFRIGVATSKSPTGPFTPEPEPIKGSFSIDPAVFIDDDGTAYMYFGGKGHGQSESLYVVRMKPNMKEFDEKPHKLDLKGAFEGAWMNKINGKYYLSYSTGNALKGEKPSALAYGISDSPYGPFTFKGVFFKSVGIWTNHHSILEINGAYYLFYHDGSLSGRIGHLRSVCVDRLSFKPDGTINMVKRSKEGVAAINLNRGSITPKNHSNQR